jgi:hypothetical protein
MNAALRQAILNLEAVQHKWTLSSTEYATSVGGPPDVHGLTILTQFTACPRCKFQVLPGSRFHCEAYPILDS